jgi:hypothetical protein
LSGEACEARRLLAGDVPLTGASSQNSSDPFDVNADQVCSVGDLLGVVHSLRGSNSASAASVGLYADVDGDGRISLRDLRALVGHLAALRYGASPGNADFLDESSGDGSGGGPEIDSFHALLGEGSGSGTGSLEILDAPDVDEEDGTMTFTVLFTGSHAGGFTIDYHTEAVTAHGDGAGSGSGAGRPDFNHKSDSIAFAGTDGETKYITVNIVDDNVVELDETLRVLIDAIHDGDGVPITSITLADGLAIGKIVNTESAVVTVELGTTGQGSVPPTGLNEGTLEYSNGSVSLKFTLSQPVDVDVVVQAATSGGTAIPDNDYASVNPADPSSRATLPAGTEESESLRVVSSLFFHDSNVELDETFNFAATGINALGRNVTFAGVTSFPVIIKNDDTATISIAWFNGPTFNEDGGNLRFRLTLDKNVDAGIAVQVNSVAGTASSVAGDYTAVVGGAVQFAGTAGEFHDVTVAVNDDNVVENVNESMSLEIASVNAQGRAVVGAGAIAGATITDNDQSVVSIVGATSAGEGNGGSASPTTFSFTVNLAKPVDVPLTVTYHTVAVSAMGGGVDFVSGTFTTPPIPANSLSGSVTIDVIGDMTDEVNPDDETFQVILDSVTPTAARAVSVDQQNDTCVATIEDDD